MSLGTRVEEAWSGIEVQLRRRADLVPNLVETVRGYAEHEQTVLENATEARAASLNAATPTDASHAETRLQQALQGIYAVAEGYPALQANKNYLQLQSELVDAEDKVQASRRFYNGGVRELNIKMKQFPNNLFVKGLGFTEREFFEDENAASVRQPPRVQF